MKSRLIVGLAVSAVLFILAARHVNLKDLVSLIKDVNLFYLCASMAFTILAVWLRALRWRFLLPESSGVKTSNLFAATMIGYMGNNLLPLRVGDIARAYMLLGGSLLALALLLWVKAKKEHVGSFIQRIFSFPGKRRLGDLSQSFSEGLKGLEGGWELVVVAFLSIPLWLLYALITYTALRASNLDLPLVASWVVLSFLGIAVSIPSAPGFIGTFQFFSVAALALFAVDEGHAFGFSLIFQFSQFAPITLIGWFLLLREHMALSDLAAIKQRIKN